MASFALISVLVAMALVYGPQMWIKHTMKKYAAERSDFEGTGGELARLLLDKAGLQNVRVEQTGYLQDHYSPMEKVVRLSRENFEGRSVTAVAVAAHEVGHALQDAEGYWPLHTRHKLMKQIMPIQRAAQWVMLSLPVVFAALHSTTALIIQAIAGLAMAGSIVVVHLFTLPTEFDASFNRALPVLQHFLKEEDMKGARNVLRAAAFTYVASALANLLNILRWVRRF